MNKFIKKIITLKAEKNPIILSLKVLILGLPNGNFAK